LAEPLSSAEPRLKNTVLDIRTNEYKTHNFWLKYAFSTFIVPMPTSFGRCKKTCRLANFLCNNTKKNFEFWRSIIFEKCPVYFSWQVLRVGVYQNRRNNWLNSIYSCTMFDLVLISGEILSSIYSHHKLHSFSDLARLLFFRMSPSWWSGGWCS